MISALTGSEIKFGPGANDIYCLGGVEQPSKKDQKKIEKKERKAKMEEEKRLKKLEKGKKKDKKAEKPITVFGCPLEEVMALQQQPRAPERPPLPPEAATLDIPIVLKVLADKIWDLQGYQVEGSFRISGSQEDVDALKKQLNEENYGNINAKDVHTVIGCLKAWIRELPEPLFPANVYSKCVTFGSNDHKEAQKILDVRYTFHCTCTHFATIQEELPELNKRVVYFVLSFVCKFLRPEYMARTKMGVENVAMIFAPLFLRCSQDMDPAMMLLNSGYESSYVQNLFENFLRTTTTA
jgi:hypothetical protein